MKAFYYSTMAILTTTLLILVREKTKHYFRNVKCVFKMKE